MNDLAAVAATELNNNSKQPVNLTAPRSSTPGSAHGDANSEFQAPNSVISNRSSVSPNPQTVPTTRPQLKVMIPTSSRSTNHLVNTVVFFYSAA